VRVFEPELTPLQDKVLDLLGVPSRGMTRWGWASRR
jgi:hypothetical protein